MGIYQKIGALVCSILCLSSIQAQTLPDCDGNGVLTANDFTCFMNMYAAGNPLANCDGSTVAPVLNANDFNCFLNLYAKGLPPPSTGWTNLTPPPGSLVFYVSNSTGNDSNAGTLAAPFKSIAKGYSMLRNGQPDQVLLKCGDTWSLTDQITLNKSANSQTQYMVMGSYGTGPRPKLRFTGQGFYGGNIAQRNGFAIVGLDLQPNAITATAGGITLLSTAGKAWDDILIEDCDIRGFSVGVVAQTLVDGDTFRRMKIRRSIIADNDNNGGGHAQGVFLGGASDWLIEDCVLDNNARSKNDMFCHNLYAHEYCGPGIFRNNISSRACSHGGQQRPGGTAENNLFLQNPINYYIGRNSIIAGNQVNTFRFNVALDSRNINSVDQRGIGYVIGGADGTIIENNIAAFQVKGTSAIDGFDIDGCTRAIVRGNVCWDWDGPNAGNPGWSTAFHFESGSSVQIFANNKVVHHGNGMLVRWEVPWSGTYTNNTYWTATGAGGVGGYMQFATNAGVGAAWTQWRTLTGDTGTFLPAAPAQIAGNIGDYLISIGDNPGTDAVAAFATKARLRSKQNDDPKYTADAVNDWVRSKFGVIAN